MDAPPEASSEALEPESLESLIGGTEKRRP